MASYEMGKHQTVIWAYENYPQGATCLDVGACDGIWQKMIGEHFVMDAVEVYTPNAKGLTGYRTVYNLNIQDLKYEWYDLIIFGDVIEHMDVPTAQQVLQYASTRCKDMIVAVPFQYPQGAIYGNPWEIHKQPDLTPAIFAERYHDLEVLHDTGERYCFYHKKQPKRRVKKGEKRTKDI